jgi:homocysteine S-methyltransferase
MGDYPDATGVFDVDSIGLTNMVNRLNHGLDVGANPIGEPTAFHIGVAANPGAVDPDKEISRFEWKVLAGAEFAVTQWIFDPEVLGRFLERTRHVRIPFLVGVWPLLSFHEAEFMSNEVPGVVVPPPVLERMREATDANEAAETGIALAREVVEAVRDEAAGVLIAAPEGRYGTALRVGEGYLGGAFRQGRPGSGGEAGDGESDPVPG